MDWILPFILLAAGAEAPLDMRYPEATEVFHCTFDETWDANYDGWPDQWTRRRGPGYPHYVDIRISEEPAPAGTRCLRFDMDGGAAAAYSPPIPVGPLFNYVLEGYLRTEGLEHSTAFLSITFLDEQRRRLETIASEPYAHTGGWRKVRVGPVAAENEASRFAVIALHVEPGEREDLCGSALFDDIWLARLPRMALSTNAPHNLVFDSREVEIVCEASGFSQPNPAVRFRLSDALGGEIARREQPLDVRTAETHVSLSLDAFAEGPSGLTGESRWRLDVPGPGFYRVEAAMQGESGFVFRRRLNLAVIDSREPAPGSEFGWTLPDGGSSLPPSLLERLVCEVGIGHVKYPLWFGEERSPQEVERRVGFIDRLSTAGIELVGMLDEPPPALRSRYGGLDRDGAAAVFAPEPEVWYPYLEPVMTRMATRVGRWQLGRDLDASLAHSARPAAKVRRVKRELDRIGQDVNLGVGWDWTHDWPDAGKEPPWRFLTLSAAPVLTARELTAYLQATEGGGVARWVALQPLPAAQYSAEVRAADLVMRMTAAKIHGAEAVSCPEPFDDEHGLMHADGAPGELLFAWRVAAHVLGGAAYLGSIDLPGGSPNHVFARQRDAAMVVWNPVPTEETVHLGHDVRQADVWGGETAPHAEGHRQVVAVDRVPKFLTGLDPAVARWRLNCRLAHERMPSVFAVAHQNSLRFRNTWPRGIAGQATIVAPDGWAVEPSRVTFRLAEDEPMEQPFTITLPLNATTGRHPLRIDFDIQGVPQRQFSVYRHVEVGLGLVYVKIETRMNAEGELVVVQRLINEEGGPVSFRCQLFIPGRPRMRTQVIGLASGYDEQVYRIADGAELAGETLWLHAEELTGPRALSYRFPAAP